MTRSACGPGRKDEAKLLARCGGIQGSPDRAATPASGRPGRAGPAAGGMPGRVLDAGLARAAAGDGHGALASAATLTATPYVPGARRPGQEAGPAYLWLLPTSGCRPDPSGRTG